MTKLESTLNGLEISAALHRELGNTSMAEMVQARIEFLKAKQN